MLVEQTVAGPAPGGEELVDIDLSKIQVVPVPNHLSPDTVPADASAPEPVAELASTEPASVEPPGPAWPRHFAVLLTEALAGARPLRQVLPLMSARSGIQLCRLQPLFGGGQRPRIMRVLTSEPGPGVVEMTLIVTSGGRARAVAVRLERTRPGQRSSTRRRAAPPWLCTDVEAA